jgi:hypothetical protein
VHLPVPSLWTAKHKCFHFSNRERMSDSSFPCSNNLFALFAGNIATALESTRLTGAIACDFAEAFSVEEMPPGECTES